VGIGCVRDGPIYFLSPSKKERKETASSPLKRREAVVVRTCPIPFRGKGEFLLPQMPRRKSTRGVRDRAPVCPEKRRGGGGRLLTLRQPGR